MPCFRLSKTLSLLFWNIRGVKNKFTCVDVLTLLSTIDILIISETHFGIRSKSPEGFHLVVRSDPIDSVKPRGGVAIYRKNTAEIETRKFDLSLPDCCIISLANTKIAIMALYIPPQGSPFYDESYFENLKTVYESLSSTYEVIMVGDLNARIGDKFPRRNNIVYKSNPDQTVNTHGQKLNNILCYCESMRLVNGANVDERIHDSHFTFFNGERKSQNDWCITNNLNIISNFDILPKNRFSDHCPCLVKVKYDIAPPTRRIMDCAMGFKSYQHYDVNKKLPKTIKVDKLDLVAFGNDLEQEATVLLEKYMNVESTQENIDIFCNDITETIRKCGLKNQVRNHHHLPTPPQENCKSPNFIAIADAHQSEYNRLYNEDSERANHHRNQWLYYEELAIQSELKEDSQEKKWKEMYHKDPAALWKSIGWKKPEKVNNDIPSSVIHNFFTNVFQSEKTKYNPTLDDFQIPYVENNEEEEGISSENISMEELEAGIKRLGSGTGIDGIKPDIMQVIPGKLKECILSLYNLVYGNGYPKSWGKQLLFPSTKKGHTIKDPKLRGIAIGPILGRLYDIIMDTRFLAWYTPNIHQSAYRRKQGSVLPLFSMFLLVDVALSKGKKLFILLLDYEKAFDYTNRVEIAKKLAEDKVGDRALRNFVYMYSETSYVAKISENEVGSEIQTKHGLTQGKNSSASLFSYYISDMADSISNINPADFFDPLNLFQVADDSTPLADSKASLVRKAKEVFDYSKKKQVVINVPKTKYMEFSEDPDLSTLVISADTEVDPVSTDKGYCWLGFWLSYADNVPSLIKYNISKKTFYIGEFYGWLQVNRETPIILKIKVLYGCMFAAILYSSEAWGNIDVIKEQLLAMERKALKCCLGVKSSVPNDIVYQELNIPDIVAKIMRLQQKFFAKIMMLEPEEAIVRQLLDKFIADEDYCSNEDSFLAYYLRLQEDHLNTNTTANNIIENNITERKIKLQNAETTRITTYKEITNLDYNNALYNSFINDELRITITRWRLSCHKLRIETGRYTYPITPRDERKCKMCLTVENESHALFYCAAHTFIRIKFFPLLCKYTTVALLLNPQSTDDVVQVGTYIAAIEKNMQKLKMCT